LTTYSNSFCEQFIGSARRECLDYIIVISELQMAKRIVEYCKYFNKSRPHQGILQKVPLGTKLSADTDGERIVSILILGGLHHEYRRVA